jgi:hypothetical protein
MWKKLHTGKVNSTLFRGYELNAEGGSRSNTSWKEVNNDYI